MRIDLIADYLEAQDLGLPGVNIFEEEMPASTKVGILLKLPLQGIPVDHELPGYFRGQLQAIVRAQKVDTGDRLAHAVSTALTLVNQPFAGEDGAEAMFVNYLRPRTLPIVYPRSDGNGKEWSINMDASYLLR